MDNPLVASSGIGELWYAVPLAVAVSLVYAATRHEALGRIFKHAMGCGAWIVGLMAVGLVILTLLSWRL
jgi:hypothetical protein